MATGIVYPFESSVNFDGNEPIAPVMVGGSLALSDESDDTYAQEWECYRVVEGFAGSAITGLFAAQPDAVSAEHPTLRLAASNLQNATEGWVGISTLNHATGLQIGYVEVNVTPGDITEVSSAYPGAGAEYLETLRSDGVRIVAVRLQTPGDPIPADYGLTVYKMWMNVTLPGDAIPVDNPGAPAAYVRTACRIYPRDDALNAGSPRIYPPPKAGRLVGGYR